MSITALPSPPSTSDPANFATKADALLAALPTFVTEANATAVAMNLNATTDASASSLAIGTGAKSFTVSTGKSFQPGMWLVIADTAAPSTNQMYGTVTSYDSATGALVMNIVSVRGSGTKTAWVVSQSAPGGAAVGANSDITSLSGTTMPTVQVFTATGTYTRPAGVRKIHVRGVAGGGAGGDTAGANQSGGGGGGGGPIDKWIDASAITTVAVTIGAAGLGASGTDGGTTSFGAYCSATGGVWPGTGSGTAGAANGGLGGIGTGNDIDYTGGNGGNNWNNICGGFGGDSLFGTGGRSVHNGGAGQNARGYGGGGAGGGDNTTNVAGGDGTPGIIIVEEFY